MNPQNQLTASQTAERLGITTRQLQALRLRGIGPSIVQSGLSIYYPLDEVTIIEAHEAQIMLNQLLQLPSPLTALKFLCDQYQLKPSAILKEVRSTPATGMVPSDPEKPAINHPPSASQRKSSQTQQSPNSCPSESKQKSAAPIAPSTEHFWYLIHTKPRQEATALTNLERQGYTCYLPKVSKTTGRGSNTRKTYEPMFPRYLFIQLNEGKADCNGHNWMPIRSTRGVDKLVQFGDAYPSLDNSLIQALRQRERDTPAQPTLKQGDTVQILDGPFKDLEAIFYNADSEHRVIILMNFLTRQLPLRIDSAKLRKRA